MTQLISTLMYQRYMLAPAVKIALIQVYGFRFKITVSR